MFSEYEKKIYQNILKLIFFLSGPAYNNNLPTLDKSNCEKVIFISGKIRNPNTNAYDYEKKVFLNVIKYCKKNSLKLYFKEKRVFMIANLISILKSSSKNRETFF